ncbi:hypothetical protein M9H77_06019 [Catharanthus roseus]|uniref:Uncharacterized protein n=1 Tax=Catharanthus roseus TaxID=4058 RepID=A0ACC0BR28_CATRO|nr:hypothetical protein M9H77_06019 [Catharanthus roseus]
MRIILLLILLDSFLIKKLGAPISILFYLELLMNEINARPCSPRVSVCGYSIPHPSDARVNIRVQTTGDAASEVLKDACQDLMLMCQHVRSTFEPAARQFRLEQQRRKQKQEEKKEETDSERIRIHRY